MKNLFTVLIATFCLTLIGCGSSAPAPGDTVKEFARAMEAGDTAKVKELCPALASMLGEKLDGMVTEASAEMKKKGGIKSITIDKEEVSEDGESAKVTATIEDGEGGTETEDFELVKIDDKWVITLGEGGKEGGPGAGGPDLEIDLTPEVEAE